MNFKFSISSNIIDFPNFDYGKDLILAYLKDITKNVKDDPFPDWTIVFYDLFSEGPDVGVFKGGRLYPSTKEKEVTIFIPIPKKEEIEWGIDRKRFGYIPNVNESKFKWLNIQYSDFNNLKDYIVESTKRGIKALLEDGVALKGHKIKI